MVPGRKLIAVQGSAYLVAIEDVDDPMNAIAVVVDGGRVIGGSAPLQSFLARGYWEQWNSTDVERTAILRLVPANPAIAVAIR